MIKRLSAFLFCFLTLASSAQITAFAVDSHTGNDETTETILDNESAAGIALLNTVEEVLAQSKYTSSPSGHGFAAERANNLADQIKGKNARIVGNDNIQNGPDRLVDGQFIQTKYYSSAAESINACFENGVFRYYNSDGIPMQIEVPSDQYDDAVRCMEQKISEGKLKGVTDPAEAKDLVRKGKVTYKQAKNMAKAGTIDSLKWDSMTGAVSAGCAFGISSVLDYSILRINGVSREEALKQSVEDSLFTGGAVYVSSVLTLQLQKTGAANIFKPTSEAIAKALGKNFQKSIVQAVEKESAVTSSKAIAKHAAKILQSEALASTVILVVFTAPDAKDMFQGRISKKQFVKNFAVTAVTVVAGTAGSVGGAALSQMVIPGIGTIPGAIIGGILIGGLSGWAADKIADYITDDDADEMYDYILDIFGEKCEEYLVTEEEAINAITALNSMLDKNMYKDIYQNRADKSYVENIIVSLLKDEIAKRPTISVPSDDEMRQQLKGQLSDVAFIH